MASPQQNMEVQANKKRNPAPKFGSWRQGVAGPQELNALREQKKLDWQKAKYEISNIISSLVIEFKGLPTIANNRFHVDKK